MSTPLSSPAATRRFASNPATPTQPRNDQAPAMAGGFDGSPTSTFSPSSSAADTPKRQPDTSQTSYRSLFATAAGVSTAPTDSQRHPLVRADPALLTCFDPADKELYDLWAPKR